jgi:membrane fusion protein (multidrug efflux system)
VVVVDAGERLASRRVELLRIDGETAFVAGGLAAGERVVVDGLQRVRAGIAVTPVQKAGN